MDAAAALNTRTLESELVSLAGHLAAGHCRWLRLLAEFDTREAWAGPGLRSCAHWLSWRVGMNLRTGFEQLRVAHALTDLPQVTEAFAAGRISYSKVRAITRVATAATETALLELALGGTASHVERVVRHTRQAATDPSTAAARRELHWRWDDDGTLVLRGRLTAEQGAHLIAALQATERRPRPPAECSAEHSGPDAAQHHIPPQPEPAATQRADALVALATGGRPVSTELVVVVNTDTADSGVGHPTARIQGGPAIPMHTAERIGCGARVRALVHDRRRNPLYLGRSRRLASPAQMTALHIRDQGRCAFPGCEETHHLQGHHIVHWLSGGRTDIDNLVLICGRHHRLIHDQGYRVRGRGTDVTFHRPDGRRIDPTGGRTSGDIRELITDPAITDDTITPGWSGERLDLDAVLSFLLPDVALAKAA